MDAAIWLILGCHRTRITPAWEERATSGVSSEFAIMSALIRRAGVSRRGIRGGQSCQNGTELSPAVADTGTLSTTWNVVASMTTMLPATSLPDVLLVVMVMTSPTMRLQRQHTAMPSERSGALMGSLSSSHLSTVPSLSSHVGYERETL